MIVYERIVGDITILDLKGSITLDSGDQILRARVERIISSGRRKVILNLEAVPYADSAGYGEIIRSYQAISRSGGRLACLNLTKRVEEFFATTKLLTVLETYESEPLAIASFGSVSRWSVCPVCRLPSAFGSRDQWVQNCANCSAESTLFQMSAGDSRLVVERVELPTYRGEKIVLRSEWPYVISIGGRLDLFSAEVVEQAWLAVPRPRKILIEILEGHTMTSKGLSVLTSLTRPEQDGGRTSVLCDHGSPEVDDVPLLIESLFTDRSAAVNSLRLSDTPATQIVVEPGAMRQDPDTQRKFLGALLIVAAAVGGLVVGARSCS